MRDLHLFPTAVREYDLSDDPDLRLINDVIGNQVTEPHRLIGWAESSYSTGKNILDHMLLKNFKSRLTGYVNEFARELGLKEVRIANSWFNHLAKNQRVLLHRHELSVISGAFYPYADPGSVGLRLHNPTSGLRMNEHIEESNFINQTWCDVECRTGLLILFPSWLEHSTEENTTDVRTTISFNTSTVVYVQG